MSAAAKTISDDIMAIAQKAFDDAMVQTEQAHGDYIIAQAIHDAVMAERAEWEAKVDEWEDKIDGLQADLDNAVDTAFARGATEWTRLNYPDRFAKLISSTKPGA